MTKLKRLMGTLKLSYRDVATEAGLSPSQVWRAAHGRGSLDGFRRITAALNRLRPGLDVTAGQLVDGGEG